MRKRSQWQETSSPCCRDEYEADNKGQTTATSSAKYKARARR
jgi:hypothetical protein